MNPLKRILVSILISSILINCMGYHIIFGIRQNLLRSEISRTIREGNFREDIIQIRIIKPGLYPQFKRTDKGEFILAGVYYDIVKEQITGDTTIFYCLHDSKEESWVNHFQTYLSGSRRQGDKAPSPLRALFQNFISEALIQRTSDFRYSQPETFEFRASEPAVRQGFTHDLSPPPKFS